MVELKRSEGKWLPAVVRIVRGEYYMLEAANDQQEMIIAEGDQMRPYAHKASVKSDDFEITEFEVSPNFKMASYLSS